MIASNEQHAHLQRLADEFTNSQFTVRFAGSGSDQYLVVENSDHRDLNEQIHCRPAADGTWCFWWPWRQPIGSVDDLETVVGKISAVLRSVEGGS